MILNRIRIVALAFLLAAIPAGAQTTRTAEIETARQEKAQVLTKEGVSRTESLMLQFKQRKIMERFSAGYNGLRIQLGSMATSSGFAFGPQFIREDLADGQIRVDAGAAVSTGLWQKYYGSFAAPHLAGDHLLLRVDAMKRDYRSLEFYGMGLDSNRGNRTDYRLKDTSLDGTAALRLARFIRAGGSVGGLWTKTGPGKNVALASTETVFDDSSAPGLDGQATFLRSSVFGQIDYRDDPLGPKSGGNYVTEYTWFDDRSPGQFGFRRWDIDVQQYIPFFNKTRRIALRARMTMTDAKSGQRVPFYLQPYIGGSDDLRGFRPYRFTGPNAVVYNAEYRWEIFSGLDGALFFDAGKVMPHRGHLAMSNLEVSPGFGLRFNARNRTFIRLDVGFSHEGVGVWIKFNDPFLPLLFGAGTRQPSY